MPTQGLSGGLESDGMGRPVGAVQVLDLHEPYEDLRDHAATKPDEPLEQAREQPTLRREIAHHRREERAHDHAGTCGGRRARGPVRAKGARDLRGTAREPV